MISTVINYKYALLSNVKAICWLAVYFLVVFTSGLNRKNTIIPFFWTTVITFFVLDFVSISMYIFDVDYTSINDNVIGTVSNQGFSSEYARLWGVFGDPNTAALYTVIAMTMGAYLIAKHRNILIRILLAIVELLLFIFVVLSGSRTAMISAVAGVLALGMLNSWKRLNTNVRKKAVITCVVGISCVIISVLSFSTGKQVIPLIKRSLIVAFGADTQMSVHRIYDEIYQKLGVDIIDGYLNVDEFDDTEELEEQTDNNPESIDAVTEETIETEYLPTEDVADELVRTDYQEKNDVSNGRFAIWMDAIELFSKTPIIGTSPRGSCQYGRMHCPDNDISQFGYAAHSTILEILMCTGIVGMLCVIYMILKTFSSFYYLMRNKEIGLKSIIGMAILLECLCAAVLLSDFFFILSFGGVALWFCMGILRQNHASQNNINVNDTTKKVLVYGPKDPVGGVEKIVYSYVQEIIKNHPDFSFDYIVYGNNFSMEQDLTRLGCRVIYLPSRKKHFFRYKKAIKDIFQNTHYIAVWGNYSGLTNIDLLCYGKQFGVPIRIAHSHSTRLYWTGSAMKYVVAVLHYFNKIRISMYATEFWACSRAAGEFMFPKSMYRNIKLIHNAIDSANFSFDMSIREQIREELNIASQTPVIGHVARMCEVKNQKFLLEVMRQVVKQLPSAKLLFVGDGELKEALYQTVHELGIEAAVIFTGERSDVPHLLQAMDVFVLCSFAEGLSVSAVEAQAVGLPCILADSIPKETDLYGNTRFLSLDLEPVKWASEILTCMSNGIYEKSIDAIKSCGYDIGKESEKMYHAFLNGHT
jgi:glycosyltransferase involved in cell wall biosynthesis